MLFYEPPQLIQTEVFTSVPTAFRKPKGSLSLGVGVGQKKESRDCFLEGPSFDREGNLYVVDIPYSRIFKISPEAEWTLVCEYDGEPNGLKVHKDGRIVVADRKQGLMQLDAQSGRIETLISGSSKERFKGLNDLVFASNGDLYFTDQGQTGLHDPTGRVYRFSASGKLDCLIDTVPSPNGIVLSPKEKALYVAVTRTNSIWVMPFDEEDKVSKAGIFVQLPSAGPDGLAMDEKGNLVVAHPSTGLVWVYDRKGVPVYQIQSCKGVMTVNIAYGGKDNKTLYILESKSGSILTARMPVAGKRMYSHAE
jgi:gluconolactonase